MGAAAGADVAWGVVDDGVHCGGGGAGDRPVASRDGGVPAGIGLVRPGGDAGGGAGRHGTAGTGQAGDRQELASGRGADRIGGPEPRHPTGATARAGRRQVDVHGGRRPGVPACAESAQVLDVPRGPGDVVWAVGEPARAGRAETPRPAPAWLEPGTMLGRHRQPTVRRRRRPGRRSRPEGSRGPRATTGRPRTGPRRSRPTLLRRRSALPSTTVWLLRRRTSPETATRASSRHPPLGPSRPRSSGPFGSATRDAARTSIRRPDGAARPGTYSRSTTSGRGRAVAAPSRTISVCSVMRITGIDMVASVPGSPSRSTAPERLRPCRCCPPAPSRSSLPSRSEGDPMSHCRS